MNTYILNEGALNDNLIYIADNGKVFKGNYIAMIKEYSFLNEWQNKETVKRFRTEKSLENYLTKNYPEFNYYA
tara:strand:- start:1508 stop:1726 length:219 start_codon:yes stop_codon:yes gene_type:complete